MLENIRSLEDMMKMVGKKALHNKEHKHAKVLDTRQSNLVLKKIAAQQRVHVQSVYQAKQVEFSREMCPNYIFFLSLNA